AGAVLELEAAGRLAPDAEPPLPAAQSTVRSWRRWESGKVMPTSVYQDAIARMFGSVPAAYFAEPDERDESSVQLSDDETVDLVARLRASRVDDETVEALRTTVDRLCTDYSTADPYDLRSQATGWLRRSTDVLSTPL